MQNRHSLRPCRSEGRFKSQALLDEAGLLTAMTYVDLNPIRAGAAATPESSEFTSIYQRIGALRGAQERRPAASRISLRSFRGQAAAAETLPCRLDDYLELVDWTGRAIRSDQRGSIEAPLPPIMQRLNVDAAAWQRAMRPNGNVFGRAMGRLDHLRLHANTLGQAWVRGLQHAQTMYA